MIKLFQNSKKKKFLNRIFQRSRKQKFLNHLKYGQEEKPVYTINEMTEALMVGDEEKAEEILQEIVKRKLKGK